MAWTLWRTVTNGTALLPTMNNFKKRLLNCPKPVAITNPPCELRMKTNYQLHIKKFPIRFLSFVLLFACCLLPAAYSFTQPTPTKTRILFVFDDSFSMFGDWQS